MKYIQLSLLLVLFSTCLACNDELTLQNDAILSEEEKEVLEDCQKTVIRTQKQIEENLIGYWELVGYACGYCSYSESPTASVSLNTTIFCQNYISNTDSRSVIDAPIFIYAKQ